MTERDSRPSTSWSEWLLVQAADDTEQGRFIRMLQEGGVGQLDFGAECIRKQLRSLFEKFETDTVGMIVYGEPLKMHPATGGALIDELRLAVTTGQPLNGQMFIGFLDLLDRISQMIGEAIRQDVSGDALLPLLGRLHRLLSSGRPDSD